MDNRIDEILKSPSFKLSIELVPSLVGFSRDRQSPGTFQKALSVIEALKPSFVSVAQGPGGSERDDAPKLLRALADNPETRALPRLAHLICGYRPKKDVLKHAEEFYSMGIRNFLILHGDAPVLKPSDTPEPFMSETYKFAYECVRDLRARFTDVVLAVAAYPDENDRTKRIEHLKIKFAAGADFAITQMLFDPETFAQFSKECRSDGIHQPLLPGVRFLKSQKQALTVEQRFKVRVPQRVSRGLPIEGENARASVQQMDELLKNLRPVSTDAHLFLLSDFELALTYCQKRDA